LNNYLFNIYLIFLLYYTFYSMGIGDWGLGIGDWGLGPIPNPQSPIPINKIKLNKKCNTIKILNKY
jgi:hypothetical protein